MMTSPGALELVEKMAGDHPQLLLAENGVARIDLRVPFYSPGPNVPNITSPTLVQLARDDDVTPFAKAPQIANRIPHGEVLAYDCSHFEPHTEPHFNQVVHDQIDFLHRHVPTSH